MNTIYNTDLKKKLCEEICLNGNSTIKTAHEYNVPLKTLEKWITAYRKNPLCFDSSNQSNDFRFVTPPNDDSNYDDMSCEELKRQLLKKDIEITRLKKGYLVKEGGMETKVFVTLSKKNMR